MINRINFPFNSLHFHVRINKKRLTISSIVEEFISTMGKYGELALWLNRFFETFIFDPFLV